MTPWGSQELEPTCWLPPSGEPASPWDPKGHPQCPLPLIIIRTKCAQLLTKYFTRIIRYDSHSNPAWSVGWLFAIYKWGNWGPEKFGGSGVVMATEWWGWDLSPGLVTLSLSWSVNSPFHHFSTYSSLSLFLFPFPPLFSPCLPSHLSHLLQPFSLASILFWGIEKVVLHKACIFFFFHT